MTESPEDKRPPDPKPARKRPAKKAASDTAKAVGIPFVLMCSGIATILGMTGGAWLGSTFAPPKQSVSSEVPAELKAELKAELQSLQSMVDRLKTRTTKLETKQKPLSNKTLDSSGSEETADTSDLAAFGEDLMPLFEDIETRLVALEKQVPTSQPIQSEIPIQKEPNDGGEALPSKPDGTQSDKASLAESAAFSQDIADLRKTIAALESRMTQQSKRFVTVTQLKSVRDQVDALETDFEKPPVLIPPFPREAVMDAITGKSEKSGSWMSGLLGDEVRVVDADVVERLDQIEILVERGNIDAIQKEVSYLPSEAKPVIDNWLLQFDQGE